MAIFNSYVKLPEVITSSYFFMVQFLTGRHDEALVTGRHGARSERFFGTAETLNHSRKKFGCAHGMGVLQCYPMAHEHP